MTTNDLKDRLEAILNAQNSNPGFQSAYTSLKQFTRTLQESLRARNARIDVLIEPGYQVNLGQLFKIIMDLPERDYRDTLFRAYIPMKGFPVSLDFYGEEYVQCTTEEELQSRILEFLQRAEVAGRIEYLMDYAKGTA